MPGYFPFTVFDTVLMGRTARLGPFSAPSRRDRAVAERVLEDLGIVDLAGEPYTRISGGQRQMVLIARALDRVRSLAAAGMAVLLSTHDPNHALLLADRVALVHGGRVVGPAATAETVTAEALWRLYGVQLDVVATPGVTVPVIWPRLPG